MHFATITLLYHLKCNQNASTLLHETGVIESLICANLYPIFKLKLHFLQRFNSAVTFSVFARMDLAFPKTCLTDKLSSDELEQWNGLCFVPQLLWRDCVLHLSSSITQEALRGRAEPANLASPLLLTLERDTDPVSAVRHIYSIPFYLFLKKYQDPMILFFIFFVLVSWEILLFIFALINS